MTSTSRVCKGLMPDVSRTALIVSVEAVQALQKIFFNP